MPEIRIPITGDASKFSKEAAKVDQGLAKIGKQATKTSKEMKSASDRLDGWAKGALAGVGIGAAVRGLDQAIDSAMRLNTQVKTSERIYGDAADEVARFGSQSATAFGMSEEAFRLNANRLGAMITNLGYTQKEAAGLSSSMMGVAADMGAAFGESPERAIEAIGAAMRGERDPIEAFGISLKQVDINAKVSALGLDTSTSAAKKHAEAVASVALIQEQAADSAGAFADGVRDGSQAAVVAAAKWENAVAKIGKALIPLKNTVVSDTAEVLDGLRRLATGWEDEAIGIRQNTMAIFKGESLSEQEAHLKRIHAALSQTNQDIDNLGVSAFEKPAFEMLAKQQFQLAVAAEVHMAKQKAVADALGLSADEAEAWIGKQDDAAASANKTTEQLEAEREELRKHIKPIKDLGDAWDDASSAMGKYFDETNEFANAKEDTAESWRDFNEALKENGGQFDWNTGTMKANTEAAAENAERAEALARAMAEEDLAWAKKSGSIENGRAALEKHRAEMVNSLMQANWTRAAAEAYLDKIGMVPEAIETEWRQTGLAESIAAAQDLAYWIEKAGGVGGTALSGIARHVDIPRRAAGGGASGPTVVGERGWEIVDLPAGSRVRSHSESVAAMATASAAPQVVHAHLHVDGRELASVLIDLAGAY